MIGDRTLKVRKSLLGSPAAGSNTSVHAAVTLGASAQDVNSAFTKPDVPRNLIVKGNASGIAGNVVITGTSVKNEVISETIALNGATAVAGNKAFRTVTNVNLPAKTNVSGDTVSIGTGVKLGLGARMAINLVLAASLGGTKEGTLPTVANSATAIESNTVQLNSAPNGTAVVLYYINDVT